MNIILVDLAQNIFSRQEQLIAIARYLRSTSLKFTVICSKNSQLETYLTHYSLPYFSVNTSVLATPFTKMSLTGFLKKSQPTIIHCFGSSAFSEINSIVASAKIATQIIYTMSSTPPEEPEPEFSVSSLNLESNFPVLEKIICPSADTMNKLKNQGIPDKLLSVVPPLPPAVHIDKTPNITGQFVFLCYCDVLNEKRIKFLFEALHYLEDRTDIPSWELRIIGRLSSTAQFVTLAEQMGIEKHLALLGEQNIPEQLAMTHVAIYHSLTPQDRNFFLLYAMEAGVPIIASAIPSSLQILGDPHNALFYSYDKSAMLASAMIRVMIDQNLYSRLSQIGPKEVAAKYNYGVIAPQMIELYRR